MPPPLAGHRTIQTHTAFTPPANGRKPYLKRALVVGAGDLGQELAQQLELSGKYHVIGFADDHYELAEFDEKQILGGTQQIERLVEQYDVDEIFVAFAPTWQQKLVETLAADHPQVLLHVVPNNYEAMMNLSCVDSLGDIALARLLGRGGTFNDSCKRAFDLLLSAMAIVMLAPVMLAVALLIKLVSPGPAIFAQERVGRNGVTFTLYKFRTMVHNAESKTGPVLANGKNDPRLTRVGRWLRLCRLDEIPQLWNVLKGDMSMVGPRPERPYFVKKYERMVPTYSYRHKVRPGITGLAQVLGGYHTDARDKLRFYLIYTSHRSLWLDIKILIRTITVVLLPKRYNWGGSK